MDGGREGRMMDAVSCSNSLWGLTQPFSKACAATCRMFYATAFTDTWVGTHDLQRLLLSMLMLIWGVHICSMCILEMPCRQCSHSEQEVLLKKTSPSYQRDAEPLFSHHASLEGRADIFSTNIGHIRSYFCNMFMMHSQTEIMAVKKGLSCSVFVFF